MSSPNILLFISDQHSPYFSGFYGDKIVDTPNMDDLVAQGTTFDEAYTPCPICVPARAAMLSCKRASTTGVFTNADALSDLTPTFLHYLVEKGYETVLECILSVMIKDTDLPRESLQIVLLFHGQDNLIKK